MQGHGLDGLGCLPGVLEVNPQVRPLETKFPKQLLLSFDYFYLGLSALSGIVGFDSVTTHF